jgi:hypothetical protein
MMVAIKPVRVIEGTVALFTCPQCREEVMARVEVEAHLGDLVLQTPGTPIGDAREYTVQADIPVRTKVRSLRVNHQCGDVVEPLAAES